MVMCSGCRENASIGRLEAVGTISSYDTRSGAVDVRKPDPIVAAWIAPKGGKAISALLERFKTKLAQMALFFDIPSWFRRKPSSGQRKEMPISGLLERFKKGLAKTAQLFNIRSWFGRKVDQAFLDDLEKRLIQADVGVAATGKLIGRVREAFADQTADENLLTFVKIELKGLLIDPRPGALVVAPAPPSVYLIAGVNGSGKTTSIAKLAQHLKDQGKTILLAACDTFRAAAADQLSIWAARAGCEIVKGAPGADPASVAHDACQRALARHVDVLIVDTAGRLHTQTHLMRELEKIRNVIQRLIPGSPHEVLLVVDATNGQNAIRQAEVFTKSIGCTGVILTKLDGTAKGGVVVAVRQTMNLPVKFVGIGEGLDDLQPFDADTFVESLFV
jgi:fused signal recognition particle receptor